MPHSENVCIDLPWPNNSTENTNMCQLCICVVSGSHDETFADLFPMSDFHGSSGTPREAKSCHFLSPNAIF